MPQNNQHNDFSSETQAKAYQERLNPWAITRLLPDMQRVTVARFRTRSDADGHLQRLRQLIPDASFMVVFDYQREEVVI
ncbi:MULTISPECIES: SPOR domain-containing protein [Calothrix]|uniref:SPOR domain-containing protein n=2 Tax=Calothrix TaxID=1186 RepID=A0ABR8AKH7_9CYAN|nr:MULTISPECIES: SPOR domain-containing protein [Calothrix]MBD2200289.1 SPOR domain-containing protein [Calothrix parietina FACHB-288]MBD2224286.1 SPOR domain-containing protein [Calothrix anomala FACHB-343]